MNNRPEPSPIVDRHRPASLNSSGAYSVLFASVTLDQRYVHALQAGSQRVEICGLVLNFCVRGCSKRFRNGDPKLRTEGSYLRLLPLSVDTLV